MQDLEQLQLLRKKIEGVFIPLDLTPSFMKDTVSSSTKAKQIQVAKLQSETNKRWRGDGSKSERSRKLQRLRLSSESLQRRIKPLKSNNSLKVSREQIRQALGIKKKLISHNSQLLVQKLVSQGRYISPQRRPSRPKVHSTVVQREQVMIGQRSSTGNIFNNFYARNLKWCQQRRQQRCSSMLEQSLQKQQQQQAKKQRQAGRKKVTTSRVTKKTNFERLRRDTLAQELSSLPFKPCKFA